MTTQFPQVLLDPLDAIALPATLDLPFVPPPLIFGLLTPPTVNAGSELKGILLIFNSQPFPVKEIAGQVDFGGSLAGTLSDISLPPAPIPGIAEVELHIPGPGGEFPVTVSLDWFGTTVERTVGTIRINPGPPPPPALALVSIEVLPQTVSLNLIDNRTQQLVAIGHYNDGTDDDITDQASWQSSDPYKVSVNSSGLVAAIAGGVAAITARLSGVTSVPPAVVTVIAEPPQPGDPPVADFIGIPTQGPAPLVVQFNNLTLGEATSYLWDFGDGQSSDQPTPPSHRYLAEGVYTVSLTAIGPGGNDTELKASYITVSAEPPPPPIGPAISAVGAPLITPRSGGPGTGVASIWAAQNQGDQAATVRLQVHNMSMQGSLVVNGPNRVANPGEPALELGASFIATENLSVLAGVNLMELRLVERRGGTTVGVRGVFPFPFDLTTIPPPPLPRILVAASDFRFTPAPVDGWITIERGQTLAAAIECRNDGGSPGEAALVITGPLVLTVRRTINPGATGSLAVSGVVDIPAGDYSIFVSLQDVTSGLTPLRSEIWGLRVPASPPPDPVLQSITILPASGVTLNIGQTQAFVATGRYSDGSSKSITNLVSWISSSPSVTTISGSGIATAISGGSSQIRATLAGITSPATTITVNSPPTGPILTAQGFPVVPSSLLTGDPIPVSWRCFNSGQSQGQAQIHLINETVNAFHRFYGPFSLIGPGASITLDLLTSPPFPPLREGNNQMRAIMIEVTGREIDSVIWNLTGIRGTPVARFSVGQFVVTRPTATFGGEIANRRLHFSGDYYEYELITCTGNYWVADSQDLFTLFAPALFAIGESIFVLLANEPPLAGVVQCRGIRDTEWQYDIFITASRTITEWPESLILAGDTIPLVTLPNLFVDNPPLQEFYRI